MEWSAIITGVLTGAAVATVGWLLGRQSERDRWNREDHLRQEAQARDRRERWLADRRILLARFLRDVDEAYDQLDVLTRFGRHKDVDLDALMAGLERLRGEIELIAPEVAGEALTVLQELDALCMPFDDPSAENEQRIVTVRARDAFLEAARRLLLE